MKRIGAIGKVTSMIYKLENKDMAAGLFAGWQETIIWSCLQNVMGEIYVNNPEHPASAMAVLGDFCFFAGTENRELVSYKPAHCQQDFIIMIPQTTAWHPLIESYYKERAKKVIRYAIKKEPEVFDFERLQSIVQALPSEYRLQMIDEEAYRMCWEQEWSKDLVSQYRDYEMYRKLGLGVVVMKRDELVAGASSYSTYQQGIEIEIDTKEAFRRRGLATICGAKLILECLERNLYPSWDAQNLWSVALAEKLGYHFEHEYPAYEIWEY